MNEARVIGIAKIFVSEFPVIPATPCGHHDLGVVGVGTTFQQGDEVCRKLLLDGHRIGIEVDEQQVAHLTQGELSQLQTTPFVFAEAINGIAFGDILDPTFGIVLPCVIRAD